jgi:DNA-binding winged helix-turn-helix (wHTH) protein
MKKRKFIKFNKQVKITIKEFLILEFLINNKDKVITRTDIIEYVW